MLVVDQLHGEDALPGELDRAMPTLTRDGCAIHYDVEGSGPPVLFIQGCGVGGDGWRPQLDALKERYTVISFDNRGYGRSSPAKEITVAAMAADSLALLDALGEERAHLVGHSLGGVIAQQLALDAPTRVKSLALLCTFARGRDGARLTPFLFWIALRLRIGPRAARRRAFLEMVMPEAALRTMDRDAEAARIGRLFGRDLSDNPSIMMQQVRALGAHDISARLHELASKPALVVSAEHDRIAPPTRGRELAAAIGTARYVEIEGAGHGVTLQKADEINQLLLEHLSRA